jgi:tricorn protease
MKIKEIIPGGPADLADSHLVPGAIIQAIDGEPIGADMNINILLNQKAGVPVQLTVQPPDGSASFSEIVTPVSFGQSINLAYDHWVDQRKVMTEKLSGGRIGYLHISAMLTKNYQKAFGEVFGELRDKEALIIDVRFNGGGNLHDQLISMFTGDVIAGFTNRDGDLVGRIPVSRWAKPSALLANAGSYSDGSIFPHLYKRQNIGPVIGTRVPGTGTAVWWMLELNNQLRYGIPQLGAKDFKTGWLENQEVIPDVLVYNDPGSIADGRDLQLEAAVTELLKTMKK